MRNWGDKLLKRLTSPDFYEEASGDLEELFLKESPKNPGSAKIRYFIRALEAIFSYRNQNRRSKTTKSFPMFKNYLLIAFRSLMRHKAYTAINLMGLAIGLASSVLITLFIWNETGYDSFHSKSKNIYRVTKKLKSGVEENLGTVPFPLAITLQEEFGGIKAAKFLRETEPVLKVGNTIYLESNFFFADPEIFDIFDFTLESGDGKKILADPNSIIISREAAARYFGTENPVGKEIIFRKWGQEIKYRVAALLKPIPFKSHIHFDFLAKYESPNNLWDTMHGKDWYFAGGAYTYVLFENIRDVERMKSYFPEFVKNHFPESVKEKVELDIQPLESIRLYSKLDNELEPGGDIDQNWILGIIGFLILLVACINFTNLATARYTLRAKEVGVRKVLGAQRNQLITQFLGEAVLLNFISLLIALAMVWLVLPFFNSIIEKPVNLSSLAASEFGLIISILLIGLFAGIVSGSYPAFFLSAFNPVNAMKSDNGTSDKSGVRKLLVIVQFSVSLILLICLSVISDQIEFMKNQDRGFNSDQVLLIDGSNLPPQDRNAFKSILSGYSGVNLVSGGWMAPGTLHHQPSLGLFSISGMESTMQMSTARVDRSFFDLYGIDLISGRGFTSDEDASNSVILNETAAKSLGKDNESVLGIKMSLFDMLGNPTGNRTVIGVAKDFNFESLHNSIKPLVLGMHPNAGFISVKTTRQSSGAAVEFIGQEWKKLFPEIPLTMNFIDDEMQSFYKREENLAGMMKGFAVIALFIGALGLFSLASFTAERRNKEIGIRKVMGATRRQIVWLIMTDFQQIVLIGLLISIPAAYFAMDRWLMSFAYRTEIEFTNFITAALITIVVVTISILNRTWRAASINPVNTLKDE